MKLLQKMLLCTLLLLNPKYVSRDEVSAEEVEHEREVLTQQALNEGKPEKIVAKMVEGRLRQIF